MTFASIASASEQHLSSRVAASMCILCGPLCLCGEITKEKNHHRDTEVTQRTTEKDQTYFSDKLLERATEKRWH